MNRRLIITGVAAAAIAGAVAPSFAATGKAQRPVTVRTDIRNGVAVGTADSRQALPGNPVVIRHDENGTVVGVGDVGVSVSPDGRICPLVSTQSWQCVGGDR